mmetsp:Transcript_26983/g.85745  ORF Transcript_26983/g.85745 Transcript_26983/m.85745 type:complete len:256 (+) Transcript_26983:637-1404(+)
MVEGTVPSLSCLHGHPVPQDPGDVVLPGVCKVGLAYHLVVEVPHHPWQVGSVDIFQWILLVALCSVHVERHLLRPARHLAPELPMAVPPVRDLRWWTDARAAGLLVSAGSGARGRPLLVHAVLEGLEGRRKAAGLLRVRRQPATPGQLHGLPAGVSGLRRAADFLPDKRRRARLGSCRLRLGCEMRTGPGLGGRGWPRAARGGSRRWRGLRRGRGRGHRHRRGPRAGIGLRAGRGGVGLWAGRGLRTAGLWAGER